MSVDHVCSDCILHRGVQEIGQGGAESGGRGHSAPVPRVGSPLRQAHVPSSSVAGPSRVSSPRKPTAAEIKAAGASRASMEVRDRNLPTHELHYAGR